MKTFPKILSKEAYIIDMMNAVEFGFKCCEKGNNLEYAKSKFSSLVWTDNKSLSTSQSEGTELSFKVPSATASDKPLLKNKCECFTGYRCPNH